MKTLETINKIHIGSRKHLFPEEMLHLESNINYTVISLKDGNIILTATTLKKLEMRLLAFKNFIRVNKSAIINLDYIKPINDTFLLSNQRKITFSRRRGKVWKEQQIA
jgi:DNA-binding LytR/AlgR family response regulator